MRSSFIFLSCVAAFSSFCSAAKDNLTEQLSSKQILPDTFKPPKHFRNVNLVRNINLEKSYPRETINVIIENIDSEPQDEYYLPFETSLISRIGGFEVKDKKNPSKGPFETSVVEFDKYSPTEYYRIKLPEPLKLKEQETLSISYSILSALDPLPATIEQTDKQYVKYTFSAYLPSVYDTEKQKTKVKFPSAEVPDYTTLSGMNADGKEDPQKQGSTFTYGPYEKIPAGAEEFVSVRYEYTKPLIHAKLLERDIEVSHWGGNLAFEDRYWFTNRAAKLKDNSFSRTKWQMNQYTNQATSALREFKVPLRIGSANPYFIDDIGNVSTSRFRSNPREANLELRPRYPLFGGWNYSFRVGWDADLKDYLRKLKTGDTYVLKVPFLEGPKQAEGVEYERVELRVILPEGATNIKLESHVPLVGMETSIHRTFMDTIGRTTLKLTAINLVDEWRDRDIIVTYDYPWTAGFRKPIVIFTAMLGVFAAWWAIGSLDVSIGSRKTVKA